MSFELFGMLFVEWHIYLMIGIIVCCLEIVVPSFFMLPIGLGFFVTALVSIFTDSLSSQFFVLATSSVLMIVLFRKYVHQKAADTDHSTNVNSIIGQVATVTEDINNDKEIGYVKLYGDRWRAIALDSVTIESGQKVIIEKLEGNKVIVRLKTN